MNVEKSGKKQTVVDVSAGAIVEDEPESPQPRLSAHCHMFPSTADLLFVLKRNLRQTVRYIKDHFLLRAAATPKPRPSPCTPGVTVTVSPSKGAVRRITTALKNIKSSADPIS